MFVFLLYIGIISWPTYSYEVSTKVLSINGELNDEHSIINNTAYQQSGPYKEYQKVIIGFGPKVITGNAFGYSTELLYIEISASIRTIDDAFALSCSNLQEIHVSNQSVFFKSDKYGSLYTFNGSVLLRAPSKKEHMILLDELETIKSYSIQSAIYNLLIIPPNVTKIEPSAFADSWIYRISFPSESKILIIDGFLLSFSTYIDLPAHAVEIVSSAFELCSKVKEISFPPNSKLTTLGISSFSGCSSLIKFDIPDGVTSLPASVFNGCSNLKSIFIPKTVQTIDTSSFSGCSSLSEIKVDNLSTYFIVDSQVLYSYNRSQVIIIPTSTEIFKIPLELKSIGQTTLQQCPNLTRLDVADEHEVYEKNEKMLIEKETHKLIAFVGGFTTSTIPDTVKELGENCGIQLSKISDVVVPENVETIGKNAFLKSSITLVVLPSTLNNISNSAFKECKYLKTVTFPNSGKIKIFDGCFEGCSLLYELNFTCEISEIWYRTFYLCGARKIVFHKECLLETYSNAFASMKYLKTVEFPSSLKKIRYQTFLNDQSLESVVFPRGNNVEQIESGAFEKCYSLKSFTFSRLLTTVNSVAFKNCYNLSKIEFSSECKINELTQASIFESCSSLVTVTLPGSLKKLDPSIFYKCTKLEKITFTDSSNLKEDNGLVYDEYNKVIICPPGRKNATVKASATAIGERCFYGCTLLFQVNFSDPSCLKSIGQSTFFECTSLNEIRFPSSVESISNSAFSGCSQLKLVRFGSESSLKNLDDDIFNGCQNLVTVDLSTCSHLVGIGNKCFSGCSKLEGIFIPKRVESIQSSAFSDCVGLIDVIFDTASVLNQIGENCFINCKKLKSIILPSQLRTIGSNCFENSGLHDTLVIPANVSSVGARALAGCPLKHIIYCGFNELAENAVGENAPIVHVRFGYSFRAALGRPVEYSLDGECAIRTYNNQFKASAMDVLLACVVETEGE